MAIGVTLLRNNRFKKKHPYNLMAWELLTFGSACQIFMAQTTSIDLDGRLYLNLVLKPWIFLTPFWSSQDCWTVLFDLNVLILWQRFIYILMEQLFYLMILIIYLDQYLILVNPFTPQRMRYPYYYAVVGSFVLFSISAITMIRTKFYNEQDMKQMPDFPFIIKEYPFSQNY